MPLDLARIGNTRLPVDGKHLRAARGRAGLTLMGLAKQSGKNYVDLSRLETGKARGATLRVLGKLAGVLGVTVEYLTGQADVYTVPVKVPGVRGGVLIEVTEGKRPLMTIRFPPNQVTAAEFWLVHHWVHLGYWRQLLLGLPCAVVSAVDKPREFTPGELQAFMEHMTKALEIILQPGPRVDADGVTRLMRLHYGAIKKHLRAIKKRPRKEKITP